MNASPRGCRLDAVTFAPLPDARRWRTGLSNGRARQPILSNRQVTPSTATCARRGRDRPRRRQNGRAGCTLCESDSPQARGDLVGTVAEYCRLARRLHSDSYGLACRLPRGRPRCSPMRASGAGPRRSPAARPAAQVDNSGSTAARSSSPHGPSSRGRRKGTGDQPPCSGIAVPAR
jgi:hypothetical protein